MKNTSWTISNTRNRATPKAVILCNGRKRKAKNMRSRRFTDRLYVAAGVVLSIAFLTTVSAGQASAPGAPSALTFEVTNGNCSPQSVAVSAGRAVIVVKMASSSPQHVTLATAGTDKKHLFEHAQVGSSERWVTTISLPSGTYELMSSLNGNKCNVTAN